MQFGKLDSATGINMKLPKDHAENARILNGSRQEKLKVYVGFPIWTHPKWVGTIYPPGAKSKDLLKYYSEQYNSIELNATRYNIPKIAQVESWAAIVNKDFKFCPKVPDFISNAKDIDKMKSGFEAFVNSVSHFEKKLGCTFLLLSTVFKPGKMESVMNLLDRVPAGFEMAIEVRHEDWFKEPGILDELANYLQAKKMPLIITDVPGRRDILHQRLTCKTAFIRFTGNDLDPSDFKRLDDWVKKVSGWIDNGLEKLYFFVHSPQKHLCPELTYYFIKQLNKKINTNLPLPKRLL